MTIRSRSGGVRKALLLAAAAVALAIGALSTANGNKVQMWGCNGGSNQQWKLP